MFNQIKEWLKRRKSETEIRRKSILRKSLLAMIRKMKTTDNQGLLRKYLFELPEVKRVDTESGWFQPEFVRVWMNDGYEVLASDARHNDAVRKAAARVIERIRETSI